MDKRRLAFFLVALLLTEYTQISFADSPSSAQEEIKKLNKQLSELIDHYNAEHDDLLATKQRLEAVEDKLSAGNHAADSNDSTTKPAETTSDNSSNNVDSAKNSSDTPTTTTPATTTTESNGSSSAVNSSLIPVAGVPPQTTTVKNPYKFAPPASSDESAKNDPPANADPTANNDPPVSNDTSTKADPPTNANSTNNDPPATHTADPNAALSSNSQNDNGGEVQKSPGPQRGIDAYLQQQNIALTRRFTVEADISYTTFDRHDVTLNGFLALNSIFLGNISIDDVEANSTEVDLIARYALTDRMQISATLPVIYRRTQFTKTGVNGSSTLTDTVNLVGSPQFGDLQAALYVLAYKETPKFPGVIWNVVLTVPTGVKPYGIKTINISPDQFTIFVIPSRMPTGLGVYSLSTGVSLTRTIDPAVIFGNLSVQYNFVRSFNDISSTPNQVVPGSIKIGDSFTYGLGIAYALNERTSVSLSYSQQVTANDSSKGVKGQWVTQKGSSTQPANINTGFTYSVTPNFAVVANVQTGLNNDAPDYVAQLKFPYTFG